MSQPPDYCESVDTSGRRTIRPRHWYKRRDGVWTCDNCGATK